MAMVDPKAFTTVLRQFPAAVNLITTGEGAGNRAGLTATAVMPLTAEPPVVLVAVNKTASANGPIRENGYFCINSLAAEHGDLARRFAGQVKGEERFATGDWGRMATGAPALGDAVVNIDCRLQDVQEYSSHHLLFGDVVAVRHREASRPLLFINGDWASLLPGTDPQVEQVLGFTETAGRLADEVLAQGGDIEQRLASFARDFAMLSIDQQAATRDFLHAEFYVSPDKSRQLNEARRDLDHRLAALLAAGAEAGTFDVDDPHITSFAIMGMISWLHRWFKPEGRLSDQQVATMLARLAVKLVQKNNPGGAHA